jgi:hypothetical protein
MHLLRLAILCLAHAGAAEASSAGVIEGVVLEDVSGRQLASATVRLEPVPGSPGLRPIIARTNRTGGFVFTALPGLYTLAAQREGFLPAAWGQRRTSGQGIPFAITENSKLFAELRMHRTGGIAGRVLDENGVGMGSVTVLAYAARLPLRSVASATSDDRGVYRIGSLEPGKYWVRTAGQRFDDGWEVVPTFGPRAGDLQGARAYEVRPDADTSGTDIEPLPGRLFRFSGRIQCDRTEVVPVIVTLSSETGRRSVQSTCGGNAGYAFANLAPGFYHVFASYLDGSGSAFSELQIERDIQGWALDLSLAPAVEFQIISAETGSQLQAASVEVIGLRDDLSGADPAKQISFPRASLHTGTWHMNVTPGRSRYVETITGATPSVRRPRSVERSADWFDVFIPQRITSRVQIVVSDKGARISGTVSASRTVSPGAPVFLFPVTQAARRSLGGSRKAIADIQGRFVFEGLPPGDYRVLASFDYTEPKIEDYEEAHAPSVSVAASQIAAVDLTLWVAP